MHSKDSPPFLNNCYEVFSNAVHGGSRDQVGKCCNLNSDSLITGNWGLFCINNTWEKKTGHQLADPTAARGAAPLPLAKLALRVKELLSKVRIGAGAENSLPDGRK